MEIKEIFQSLCSIKFDAACILFTYIIFFLFLTIAGILTKLKDELQYNPLPIAQADLVMEPSESNTPTRAIPFIHVSVM